MRALGALQADRFAAVHFYSQLLAIETPWVGDAYLLLQRRVRRQTSTNARRAWQDRRPDGQLWADTSFTDDTAPELALCLAAMQADVAWLGRFRRPGLRRRLRRLAADRPLPPWPRDLPPDSRP